MKGLHHWLDCVRQFQVSNFSRKLSIKGKKIGYLDSISLYYFRPVYFGLKEKIENIDVPQAMAFFALHGVEGLMLDDVWSVLQLGEIRYPISIVEAKIHMAMLHFLFHPEDFENPGMPLPSEFNNWDKIPLRLKIKLSRKTNDIGLLRTCLGELEAKENFKVIFQELRTQPLSLIDNYLLEWAKDRGDWENSKILYNTAGKPQLGQVCKFNESGIYFFGRVSYVSPKKRKVLFERYQNIHITHSEGGNPIFRAQVLFKPSKPFSTVKVSYYPKQGVWKDMDTKAVIHF